MSSNVPTTPTLPGGKIFLLNKEKFWGWLTGIGAAIVGGFALLKIMPFVNQLLGEIAKAFGTLVEIGVLCVAGVFIFGILYWIIKNAGWIYTTWSRKVSMAIIRMNPIEMLEGYANEYLESKYRKFTSALTDVRKQQHSLEQTIGEMQEKYETAFSRAESLKKHSYNKATEQWQSIDDLRAFNLASAEADMLEKSIQKLVAQLERLKQLVTILDKFRGAFEYQINTIRLFVDIQKTEYEALKSSAAAAGQAMDVFRGDERKQLFEMAASHVRDQIGFYMGQVETALSVTESFVSGHEVDTYVASDKMLSKLTMLEQSADQLYQSAEQMQQTALSGDMNKVQQLVKNQPIVSNKTMPSLLPQSSKYRIRKTN